ncbi:MAG: deoxyribodipyrimidine photo-lyase [candidate division WOR-3 bacterium]|nr:MAG: deoxyribodipyrimidine photo-lyase [candidate division WOR-3 bacterium]
MIQGERIMKLNDKPVATNKYVLYWMQQAQRSEYNHALEYAIDQANKVNKPLIVCFGLTDNFPEANERHYYFMLEGLRETTKSLSARGIKMVIQHGSPEIVAAKLAQDACAVITDCGYLKIQRRWRDYIARNAPCLVTQVETDVVIPVTSTSTHQEYSAATIRKKIQKKLNNFLIPVRKINIKNHSLHLRFKDFPVNDTQRAIRALKIDRSVARVVVCHGGTSVAKELLRSFINKKLSRFPDERNDPSKNMVSSMSPYLHFGQISPLYIALQVMAAKSPGTNAFLEELIVRRELSMNYVFYNRQYDSLEGLPEWAQTTLKVHKKDRRPYAYGLSQLEHAETHDKYWNAAQTEMLQYGKMHGYMRMYWGKKIIEWTKDPSQAFKIALYLNNKYELDGRDANGYTGVAWCFGKHDRPWPERKIFGKVRYMNAEGLRRKFKIDSYVNGVLQNV